MTLSQLVQQAIAELPWAPLWAFRMMIQERTEVDPVPAIQAALESAAPYAEAWSKLVAAMTEVPGAKWAREALEQNVHDLKLGFNAYSIWQRGHAGIGGMDDW